MEMTMKILFVKDFDFSPEAKNGTVTVAYKAGQEYSVTREAHRKAFAAGAVTVPPKEDEAAAKGTGGK
jgi:hypothetical protein